MKFKWFVWIAILWPLVGWSQDYRLSSPLISGGGGRSASGALEVTSTIGQAVAGNTAGGALKLRSGFFATLELVSPEPGAWLLAWMDSLAAEDLPPEDERGAYDQPADDGVSNLWKYSLGLRPMTPAVEVAPRLVVVPVDDGDTVRDLVAVEFERSVDAAVEFQVESATEISGWSDAPFMTEITVSDAGNGRERVRLVTGIRVAEHTRHFLRLRVRVAE